MNLWKREEEGWLSFDVRSERSLRDEPQPSIDELLETPQSQTKVTEVINEKSAGRHRIQAFEGGNFQSLIISHDRWWFGCRPRVDEDLHV